jgi:ankyrin repeat protein
LACQHFTPETSGQIIRLLLATAPETASERDVLGRLPLHYACSNGAGVMTIDALLHANCWGAAMCDKNGWLPIHVACKSGASFLVVQRLIDAHPEAIHCRTLKGSTPLDLMDNVNCRCKKEIIKMLSSDDTATMERSKNTNSCGESWRSELTV